ncbi:unnamed protein product [Enterobius vermicularis]|uniref:Ketoacyl_synth_N domain-containing protein n=1 Tax=Enterobius vermicularis TaxID=51028 RepID=A0A0N4VNP6_ENTVE|nr:unnamed protein product [Enterobius vermicularis]
MFGAMERGENVGVLLTSSGYGSNNHCPVAAATTGLRVAASGNQFEATAYCHRVGFIMQLLLSFLLPESSGATDE